ncbi:MAG: hypothetical protein ABSG21_11470 [Spirochaetia bacterium]
MPKSALTDFVGRLDHIQTKELNRALAVALSLD